MNPGSRRTKVPTLRAILATLATMTLAFGLAVPECYAAIAFANPIYGSSTNNVSSYATASFTPVANRLNLIWVTNTKSTTPDTPTLSGNGLTWVQVATITWGTTGTPTARTTLFRAMGASPTAGSITISFGGVNQSGCAWNLVDFSGVDTTGTNGSGAVVQAVTGAANSAGTTGLSITLAALAFSGNATAGGFSNFVNNDNSITAGTGYTATNGVTYANPSVSLRSQVAIPGRTVDNVAQSATSHIAGIAVEIRDLYSRSISGTVYEDVNYGGGAGRSRAASSGVVRSGARVELYDNAGAYVTFGTTDGSGNYSFTALAPGNYTVRVVDNTVTSSRTGYVSGLLPVLTYRTNASSGTAVGVTDYVGGQNPAVADAPYGTSGAVMNTTTGAFTAGISGTAQSFSPVTISTANVSGVEFGFNFDTVANVNNAGRGSLRQFIANANALSNTGLAQSGRPAGIESAIFMISNGTSSSGLRAANNYFSGGAATISVATWLPHITNPVVLDGRTQPGYGSAPIIELNGSATTYNGTEAGLVISAGNSVVRGLVINRFAVDGIRLETAGGNTVEGNYLGTDPTGMLDRGNGYDGIYITGSSGNTIGGSGAGAGNVVAANNDDGIDINTSSSNLIEGNLIGLAADGTTALGNANHGIVIRAGNASGNRFRQNRIGYNGGLGIDLRDDGVTANDGLKTAGQPNLLMDFPVFTSAMVGGTTLTVAGYVGSAPNQSTFAGATVELFKAAPDPGGYGEGSAYLGTLTADASGNFSGSLTVSGVVLGDRVTGTATDGSGNTSEFGPHYGVGYSISGTVYEDVNYGGGAGRTRAGSSGVVRPGARVELYSNAGAFVASTTTDVSGNYFLSGLAAGSYTVRAVSASVTSSRTGAVAGLLPVLTFRTNASSGTAVGVTDYVGGHDPATADAGDAAAGWVLNAATGVFSGSGSGKAHAFAPVTVSAANVTGVDFGWNFDTIVNTNSSGQGSLRQFIANSNALGGEAGLAQSGSRLSLGTVEALPSGKETSIFMISNGAAHPGLRAGLANQLTAGVAVINVTGSALPALAGANAPNTVLDGTTQTQNVGDTNAGVQGTGGTVGVSSLTLNPIPKPEIEIRNGGGFNEGISLDANTLTVRGIAIWGFGNNPSSSGQANVEIGNNYTGALIEQNYVGTTAVSFADPGVSRTKGSNVRSDGGDSGIVRNNLVGFAQGSGFWANSNSNGWLVEGNEFRHNGWTESELDGVVIMGSSGATVRGNLVHENEGVGIDTINSTGSNTIENNTVHHNGVGSGNSQSLPDEWPGIRLWGSGNVVDRNVVYSNYGAGVMVTSSSTGNRITQNSIYANGTILNRVGAGPTNQAGIDLLGNADVEEQGTAPFVTPNDSGDADTGANGLLNFPILSTATISGGNLVLSGFARPGSTIELFLAETPPDGSGFGEGKTYLVTLVEGSAADTDGTTGSYANPVNGLNQGTDNTNRFSFSIPAPGGVVAGDKLTATATLGGATSEFGGIITVVSGGDIAGTVFEDANYGGGAGRSRAVSSGVVRSGARVELYDSGGAYITAGITDGSGNYSFPGLSSGNYTVRVMDNTVTSSRSGYVAGLLPVLTYRTNASSGTAVGVTDYVGGQDPAVSDAPYGMAGAVMNTTTGVFTAGISGTAQSFSPVTIGAASVSGVDFGFNFDTIVNGNGSGRGSLRQFLLNSNALGNAGLAVQGQTAGKEVSIFMIGNGQAHPGLRAGLANLLSASGVAVISPATVLPSISGADTTVDGTTQTANVGNTNAVVLGTGGTVGADGLALNQVAGPEVEILGINSLPTGLRIQANNAIVRGVAIHGFGAAAGEGGIRIDDTFTGTLIENNVIGSTATSFTDPGAVARNWIGIDSEGGDSGTIRNNLIGFSEIRAIMLAVGSNSWAVDGNEIRDNGLGNADGDGISINASSSNAVTGNLFAGASSQGIIVTGSGGTGNACTNNTVTGNGVGISSGLVQTAGITVRSGPTSTVFDRNVINANYGAGIQVNNGATDVRMTRNSFFANGTITARNGGTPTGQIGIDLNSPTDNPDLGTSPFYTPNDSGDADTGGNNLLNFPILSTATVSGGNLTLTGFARPGSTIELFLAETPPDGSGFGEGKTYLVTLVEGSAADTDGTTGSYANPVNGLNQGTDNTNRFSFSIPAPGGVVAGDKLTATATLGSATSEFGGNVTIGAASYQPDAMIKLASEGPGAYATDNVYESTASTQGKSQGVVSAAVAVYHLSFQNDGNVSDNLVITQAAADNCTGFTVQYLDNTSTDRTAAVTGAGYSIAGVAPGAGTTWTLRVTPGGTVRGGSPACGVSVTATSTANGTKKDQVRAQTASTSADLTLLKSADRGTVQPGQDIAYTVNATNGSGLTPASSVVVSDPIPAWTGFKVGSAMFSPGTSTLVGTPSYSNDGGATWSYTPVSAGCAAPAGYDFCVTNVRWTTAGTMPAGTSFTVNFVVRVK